MRVLDLFCGGGGLADGFRRAGFDITGVDNSEFAGRTFELNIGGKFLQSDLSKELIADGKYDAIVGGPPCRPWSSVNVTRRGRKHSDYKLLTRFFEHVEHHIPRIFILENVRPLGSDPIFLRRVRRLRRLNYSVASRVVSYSDYGAATKRHRLIVVGMTDCNAETFFQKLARLRVHRRKTVKHAIWHLRSKGKGEVSDHVWPDLRTIDKYRKYYLSGKFGWYVLDWMEPAPSFGNIMKTYILHPDAFDGRPTRVISVREGLLIMGFGRSFRFPAGIGVGARYQMVVDSVSPMFSYRLAKVSKALLLNGGTHDGQDNQTRTV